MPKDEFGWKKANKKKKKKKKYATIGTANFTSLRVEIIINKIILAQLQLALHSVEQNDNKG